MAGIRGMARQRELLSELLSGTESMRVFITHHMDGDEELRLRLERSKIDLATAQKIVVEKTEALKKVEVERKIARAKLKEAEQENSKLREKIEELWSGLSLDKKQKEDLQLRLVTQRKELKVGFAVQRKALETEYQKQVDGMYFFGYRCCMKKNGIMCGVPSILSEKEDNIPGDPPQ